MLLEPTEFLAIEQFNGVIFAMTDHRSLFSVLVTHDALHEIDSAELSEDEYLMRFEAFKADFEMLASEKFNSGFVQPGGSIRIEASDIEKFG